MTKITDDMLSSGTDLESSVRDFQKFIKEWIKQYHKLIM